MSLISKLLVKLNPITIFITPNVMKEMRRNISKRYTIGQHCDPEAEPDECPDPCRRVKTPLPIPGTCIAKQKRAKDRSKPAEAVTEDLDDDYGYAKYNNIYKSDKKIKGVKKPGKYTTSKCDPFPRDEQEFSSKLIRCKPNMRDPCNPPVPEHLCSITKGKILYTTNKRPEQKLPNCPKGNWSYKDPHNKS